MKNLIFIFLLLPISIFGQTEISVDSVSLIEYSGYATITPKPKPPNYKIYKTYDYKNSEREKAAYEQKAYEDFIERFPNYVEGRDMREVRTHTILDSKGRFHPSAKWETYRTFPSDSVSFLLDILNCKIPEIDTIHTIDNFGNETLTFKHRPPHQSAMCFAPGLGILIWSKGEIIDFYSVCFKCSNVAKGTNDSYMREYQGCIYIDDLKMEVERLYGL